VTIYAFDLLGYDTNFAEEYPASYTLKLEAERCSETLVHTYQAAPCNNPEIRFM
jgi:hypothetical protein